MYFQRHARKLLGNRPFMVIFIYAVNFQYYQKFTLCNDKDIFYTAKF